MENVKKINIIKKILKIIFKILYNVLIIFCLILIAIIVMQKITDSNNSIAGYRLFRIISGSMSPKYDIGEVVICKETEGRNIKIGDEIVYKGKTKELKDKIVMHEVIEINYDENNNLQFYAKGLANNEEDPEVNEEQIYGVVKFKSNILTILYKLATSMYSSFIIITVLVINVFLSFKTANKRNKEKQDNIIEDLEEPAKKEELIIEIEEKEENTEKNKQKDREENNKEKKQRKEQTDKEEKEKEQKIEENNNKENKTVKEKKAKENNNKENKTAKEKNNNNNKEQKDKLLKKEKEIEIEIKEKIKGENKKEKKKSEEKNTKKNQ